MVERLFLTVPLGCLQFVIVVFPDHTHLLFFLHIPCCIYLKNLPKYFPFLPRKLTFSHSGIIWEMHVLLFHRYQGIRIFSLGGASFVPRALFGANLNMVHPLGYIRDLGLVVSNQEIFYVSIYKSM